MTRMIISDIDGTLLPRGRADVPERVLRALQRAVDQGIEVVIASGRLYSDIPKDLWKIRGLRYVVTCNGASITDRQTGAAIYGKKIPSGQAADVIRILKSFDCYPCAYLAEGPCNWKELPEKLDNLYPNRYEFFRQDPHEDLPEYLEEHGEAVEKIFAAVFSEEARHLIRREMSKIAGIRVTSSSPKNLEINHIDADKGSALSWLCRYLEIDPEDVVAMGDNENDYNMLALAGTAVVPADGAEVVVDRASYIAPPCKQCGMAVYLEREVLRQESTENN